MSNVNHKKAIENLLNEHGINFISTTRKASKRGGGAAIAWKHNEIRIKKLNVSIPPGLEVVWALYRPDKSFKDFNKVLLCSFYSPPLAGKKSSLVSHTSEEVQRFLSLNPGGGIVLSGDANSLDVDSLLKADSSLVQIVKIPTRKDKTLDIFVTNLQAYYQEPFSIPPLLPDNPQTAHPSDHLGVLVLPVNSMSKRQNQSKIINIRHFPQSKLDVFGQIMSTQNWSFLNPKLTSTQLVSLFQYYTSEITDSIFPETKVKVSEDDKPYFTEK